MYHFLSIMSMVLVLVLVFCVTSSGGVLRLNLFCEQGFLPAVQSICRLENFFRIT